MVVPDMRCRKCGKKVLALIDGFCPDCKPRKSPESKAKYINNNRCDGYSPGFYRTRRFGKIVWVRRKKVLDNG